MKNVIPHYFTKLSELKASEIGVAVMKIESFDPIINKDSEILILGSMPGNESLKQQQYYAHPQNKFWQFIYRIFDKEMDLAYTDRTAFLERNKIALWDVFKYCEREGSLDSNIKNEEINDVAALLEKFKNIKYVFLNGGKAYDQFKKRILPDLKRLIPYMKLPSTSPANNSIPMDKKLNAWKQIRYALNNRVAFESALNTEYGDFTIYSDGENVTSICLPGGERPSFEKHAVLTGDELSEKAKTQIHEYLQGKRKAFDVPVLITGTPFQKRIYSELLKVPYGHTVSYGQLAEMAGNKGAARAVGQTMRKNPVPLIVPCHRVIGSNGKNVGFMGVRNNPMQDILLDIEQKFKHANR